MLRESEDDLIGRRVLVRGAIQGVGFRPFVYRLARRHGLCGWVRNAGDGVEIHLEGDPSEMDAFSGALIAEAPSAAVIEAIDTTTVAAEGHPVFLIVPSRTTGRPTAQITPDLRICSDCLAEMRNPDDRRYGYPYINCTNCGPRYSIVERLPYDRPNTTMAGWMMCGACTREYLDPLDRRFHAQPTACRSCGPDYILTAADGTPEARGGGAVRAAVRRIIEGQILAVKGIGGYHLACDAMNAGAVAALRERKFRKEKPFALMASDLTVADTLADVSPEARHLLGSVAGPIVLLPAKQAISGVAPGMNDLGIMLPYAPLHFLLFDFGAPQILVLTSANRSNEPIAIDDEEAYERLRGIADAFLVGERPIARRVEDSVVRIGPLGPAIQRRARGYAPSPVASLPTDAPVLAVGADLKNTVTLVVQGQAFMSPHLGDLEHLGSITAFREAIADLLAMYGIDRSDLQVVHDAHPQYVSTMEALELGPNAVGVQHHHAHIASVLAEHDMLDRPVLGIALDGTGWGSDGAIWGGEFLAGSVRDGFVRAAHLRETRLPGGDAAARHPVQAASGFVSDIEDLPDLEKAPFEFGRPYRAARRMLDRDVRVFRTTSTGRLFDAAAALCGFNRAITFEGQAAMWLEHQARRSTETDAYPFPALDFRPLLSALIDDRRRGRDVAHIARAFHIGLARGLAQHALAMCDELALEAVVLSGGVFQNQLLLAELVDAVGGLRPILTNRIVPCNDGGISLGQAASAACCSGNLGAPAAATPSG